MGKLATGGTPRLYRIIYDSVSLLPQGAAGDAELQQIMQVAQRRNARDLITRALHCDGAFFLQVLEGERGPVVATMSRIQRDTRHMRVRILEADALAERDFEDWSMALVPEPRVSMAQLGSAELRAMFPQRTAEVVGKLRTALGPPAR